MQERASGEIPQLCRNDVKMHTKAPPKTADLDVSGCARRRHPTAIRAKVHAGDLAPRVPCKALQGAGILHVPQCDASVKVT